jgi:hypothetical protein
MLLTSSLAFHPDPTTAPAADPCLSRFTYRKPRNSAEKRIHGR